MCGESRCRCQEGGNRGSTAKNEDPSCFRKRKRELPMGEKKKEEKRRIPQDLNLERLLKGGKRKKLRREEGDAHQGRSSCLGRKSKETCPEETYSRKGRGSEFCKLSPTLNSDGKGREKTLGKGKMGLRRRNRTSLRQEPIGEKKRCSGGGGGSSQSSGKRTTPAVTQKKEVTPSEKGRD